MRGKPVSTQAESLGVSIESFHIYPYILGSCLKSNYTFNAFDNFQLQLEKYYDTAIADGSDDSTASTQATQATFGRVTRLGLQDPRDTRPARRDVYTAHLEHQVQTLSQESEVRRQESEAANERIATANQRIATLEASQREMQQILARLLERQQGGGNDGT